MISDEGSQAYCNTILTYIYCLQMWIMINRDRNVKFVLDADQYTYTKLTVLDGDSIALSRVVTHQSKTKS